MTEVLDERFYKAKPKRKSKAKAFYYETQEVGMYPDLLCQNCGFTIVGPKAIYYAGGLIPGPFCRPECAMIYNDIPKKGRMLEGKPEED